MRPLKPPGFEDRAGLLTPEQMAHEWTRLKGTDPSHDEEDIVAARVMPRSLIEQALASGKSLVIMTCRGGQPSNAAIRQPRPSAGR